MKNFQLNISETTRTYLQEHLYFHAPIGNINIGSESYRSKITVDFLADGPWSNTS